MRDAMDIIIKRLAKVIYNLSKFALKWKAEPTLAYTHLQPAQLITVGKRGTYRRSRCGFCSKKADVRTSGTVDSGPHGMSMRCQGSPRSMASASAVV